MWFEIAVNDDVERAKGDGGRVQKGAETMGEAFAEGWKSKVRVPQQLQNRTNRGEHGKERIGGQFAFPWPGKTIVVLLYVDYSNEQLHHSHSYVIDD